MSWFKQLWQNSREKGQYYELQAQKYLQQQGLTPIERNYNCPYGELDVIMRDGDTLVFIEVKFRASSIKGGAMHALGKQKQQRLKRTIYHYLAAKQLKNQALRIDFVAITGDKAQQLNWIKNVF
ncbi:MULTISPECIES: YraN family protein [unclassified Pseudoalteromonas]|uniref:YraN family protein n=1 Tax=unclassified Pseudoalteromonas TaxID=194690 RepID=UPI0025B4FEF4|nr:MULTISPECIES: YraN family protein [unclassified Pseudoalteromonas]MDN3380131.1 YraN family protein [Pseudoalteromonas sp. APC 3893]MDN3386704.1 YraN family protein [Pseudoalteromonas sp. APC 4017]